MGWKPVTPETVAAYEQCLAERHDGHEFTVLQLELLDECFDRTFVRPGAPITLATFVAYQQCLMAPREQRDFTPDELGIISECFQRTFLE